MILQSTLDNAGTLTISSQIEVSMSTLSGICRFRLGSARSGPTEPPRSARFSSGLCSATASPQTSEDSDTTSLPRPLALPVHWMKMLTTSCCSARGPWRSGDLLLPLASLLLPQALKISGLVPPLNSPELLSVRRSLGTFGSEGMTLFSTTLTFLWALCDSVALKMSGYGLIDVPPPLLLITFVLGVFLLIHRSLPL